MIDIKTRQLLQLCSSGIEDYYICMAPLPAGRIAAGNAAGMNVLALEMDGSELASGGLAGQPRHAAKTTLLGTDAFPWCATCLGSAGPNDIACASRVAHI